MRVLIITNPLPTPGDPTTLAPLARQIKSLRDLGVEMDVLQLVGRSVIKYGTYWPRLIAMAKRVDLVHAHYGYCGWLGRLQIGKPLVVSFMGSDVLGAIRADGTIKRFSKVVVQLNRIFAHTARAVIVKSPEMAQVIKPVPSQVIPNGVDTGAFQPAEMDTAKQQLGWALDKKYVLFPGNPRNVRKGFSLAQATVDVASEQLGEALEIAILHDVEAAQVPLYMNACDAMIMASFIEGSPNVVKEAMACNLPTVSVPVGDVDDLLSGVEGCVIRPRDPEQLGAELARLIDRGQRSTGRQAIMQKELDLEGVARKIKNIYEQVLKVS